jgi:hypothetical protein
LRDKIWFHPTIQLRYETSADQLRYVLAEIRQLLYAHPKVESTGSASSSSDPAPHLEILPVATD